MHLPLLRLLAVLSTLAMVALSCDNGDGEGAAPPETTTTTGMTTTTEGVTTTTAPGGELVRCTNPEGFSIEHPRRWEVDGCSQFHPEPFEPPGATDERVAAITAYVDPVALDVVAEPQGARDLDRTELTIDGHRSLRLSYRTDEDSLYPAGTPVTLYAVEFPAGPDGRERTLFVDTVGLSTFSYAENVEVLDRMAPTVEIAE